MVQESNNRMFFQQGKNRPPPSAPTIRDGIPWQPGQVRPGKRPLYRLPPDGDYTGFDVFVIVFVRPAKSNEITAIPELLRLLDIQGCIVTIDAMGCQKNIARQLVADKQADYVMALNMLKKGKFQTHQHQNQTTQGRMGQSIPDQNHSLITNYLK